MQNRELNSKMLVKKPCNLIEKVGNLLLRGTTSSTITVEDAGPSWYSKRLESITGRSDIGLVAIDYVQLFRNSFKRVTLPTIKK